MKWQIAGYMLALISIGFVWMLLDHLHSEIRELKKSYDALLDTNKRGRAKYQQLSDDYAALLAIIINQKETKP